MLTDKLLLMEIDCAPPKKLQTCMVKSKLTPWFSPVLISQHAKDLKQIVRKRTLISQMLSSVISDISISRNMVLALENNSGLVQFQIYTKNQAVSSNQQSVVFGANVTKMTVVQIGLSLLKNLGMMLISYTLMLQKQRINLLVKLVCRRSINQETKPMTQQPLSMRKV